MIKNTNSMLWFDHDIIPSSVNEIVVCSNLFAVYSLKNIVTSAFDNQSSEQFASNRLTCFVPWVLGITKDQKYTSLCTQCNVVKALHHPFKQTLQIYLLGFITLLGYLRPRLTVIFYASWIVTRDCIVIINYLLLGKR